MPEHILCTRTVRSPDPLFAVLHLRNTFRCMFDCGSQGRYRGRMNEHGARYFGVFAGGDGFEDGLHGLRDCS